MFALEGLAPLDGWVVAAIVAKALGYGAALLAAGGPLFLAAFPKASDGTRGHVRRITRLSALAAALLMVLRLDIRAGRISGMGVEGMVDPVMVSIVWESPFGDSILLRGIGLALVLFSALHAAWALGIAALGSVLVAWSYAQVGHSLGEPRLVLAALLTVHLLTAAFWVAALLPLHWGAARVPGAVVLQRFGTIATGTVPTLVIVGGIFAYLMVGSLAGLVGTAYGIALLAKVAIVSLLLGLAAHNKLRLVPSIARGEPGAAAALRRSVAWEGAAIAAILLLTATLTSITTPPANL